MKKKEDENDKKNEAKVSGSGLNKKKRPKKLSAVTRRSVELGQFEVRISDAKVDIETMAKNWKISYSEGTTPYFIIKSLVANSSLDSLRTLILALYSTSIFFVDANTVMAFIKIVNDFKGSGEKPLSEEDDQAVLEELKAEHDEGADNIELQKDKEKLFKKVDDELDIVSPEKKKIVKKRKTKKKGNKEDDTLS